MDDLEILLNGLDLDLDKSKIVNGWFMFKCPLHGERRPSAGINAEWEMFSCFACQRKMSLAYFVAQVKGISFKKAQDWLEEHFNVSKYKVKTREVRIKLYDDFAKQLSEMRKDDPTVLPNYKLAPFKSGKVCHSYLLDRGFTKEICAEFNIGWDDEACRITVPIFGREQQLYGFSKRAVLEPTLDDGEDNPEYIAIYGNSGKYLIDEFQKSKVLFPLDKFVLPPDKSALIVEGILDAVWLYQLGFTNTLSTITATMHKPHIKLFHKLGIRKLVFLHDNDEAGEIGKRNAYKLCKQEFTCYDVQYPKGKKDPQQMTRKQILEMIKNKKLYGFSPIKRII
jgi:DNA primase